MTKTKLNFFKPPENCKDTTKCLMCLKDYCPHRQSQAHISKSKKPPQQTTSEKQMVEYEKPTIPAENPNCPHKCSSCIIPNCPDRIEILKIKPHITQDLKCQIISVPMEVVLEHVMVMLEKNQVPDNTKVLSTTTDPMTNSLFVKITHPTFDSVLVGDAIPIYRIKKET